MSDNAEKPKGQTLADLAQRVYKTGLEAANSGKYDEAIGILENMNMLLPAFGASMLQAGRCHWEMHRWESAAKCFDVASRLEPKNDDIGWTVGLLALQMGDFEKGWQGYERRWGSTVFESPKLHTKHPLWQRGKNLVRPLVWCEQGIGDQILYASLIEALASEVEHVTVLVDIRMVNLFQRGCKAKNVTYHSHSARVKMRDHDSHIPMASLGKYFINRVSDIPLYTSQYYIKADTYRVKLLREELNLGDNYVVGLCWNSTAPSIGAHKSVPLEQFKPILDAPNTKFLNLQYGEAQKQGENFHPNLITTHIDTFLDLENVAAMIELCNVVVSPSCANVHLAGAMGKDILLLDANKLWYWNNRQGNESLWYPGVRIYQRENMNAPWDLQLKQVEEDLNWMRRLRPPRVRDTFVFFHVGDDITAPQKMVKSLLRHNPNANVIMCTDKNTPDVMGVTCRREFDVDRNELMAARLKAHAELGLCEPALYLDTDMIFMDKVSVRDLLGDKPIAMCRRDFNREAIFMVEQRGIRFDEYENKPIDEIYPYLGCATATRTAEPWIEMVKMLDGMDSKYRRWYGDQEALREYAKTHEHNQIQESVFGCLPEHKHDGAKILHYKGPSRKKLFEEL